jgi:LmbE family N-acetylglucosaminyl deacetylase
MTAGEVQTAMDALPDADLDTILGTERPLILAPHADDESLGCGGLIAASCARGRQPFVVILTDGTMSHPGSKEYPPERLRQVRVAEARQAVAKLGLAPENLTFFEYRDTALPVGPAVTARVAALARKHACTVILSPWLYDPHCDHESAAIVAREAAKAADCKLMSYPVWGWLLPPNHVVPVSKVTGFRLPIAPHLETKRCAVAAHASQYSDLIQDSPDGFRLPRELLSVFERPYEVFLT